MIGERELVERREWNEKERTEGIGEDRRVKEARGERLGGGHILTD